ncbi:methyltransferase domain-containing protein [Haliangium ochraceum]|uniref:Methyltransferase type 11 n=1 Tax=Haliangium ochraceum (strain DSM 14365 / JCM 11303 / SMP-2) TaxID=502025 RepID=D0LQ38_HALO1|nr:methyltransferase domain-containing protein [Haliangium ochraceum]ACY17075.1 Methyltransferase type 11 [Haliangium ochraceum DSM 14365]
MSKESDKDVEEAGDDNRPRRRRRSGLRVPSDDVPRRQRAADASPDASPDSPDSVDQDDPGAEADEDSSADGGHASGAEDSRDSAEMPAERPLHYRDAVAGGADDPAPDGDASGDEDDDGIGGVPVYQEDRPAIHARAITQEMLHLSADDAEGAGGDGSDEVPADSADGDSDSDSADGDSGSEDASDDPGRALFSTEPPKTVKMDALPFGVESGAPVAEADEADSVDIPIEEDEPSAQPPAEAQGKRPIRHARAATMALGDDDLEVLENADLTLLEGSDGAAEDDSARRRAAAEPEQAPVAGELNPSQGSAEASDQRDQRDDSPSAGPHAAEPEDAAVEEGDNSDSGEILADDMIEEVDDPGEPESAEPQPQAPPKPPPKPRKSAAGKGSPPPAPKASEPPSKPKTRRGKPWFEELFDEDYLRTLPFLTPQATRAEALFVAEALGVKPGARLLDIGCGYGRHAMELAAHGYQIVALDYSLPLLLRGADEAQRRGLNINFVHGDMRDLAFDGQFDGVYCLFSTFGYFDEETNRSTLEGMARALQPGGRMVLDILNRDYLIGDLPTRVWWEGDGCVVLEEVEFNYFNSRVHSNRSIVFDDGRQLEQEISWRAYSLHEIGKLLHGADMRVREVSGSMATRGRFFGNQSREIIVIAEKKANGEAGETRDGDDADSGATST